VDQAADHTSKAGVEGISAPVIDSFLGSIILASAGFACFVLYMLARKGNRSSDTLRLFSETNASADARHSFDRGETGGIAFAPQWDVDFDSEGPDDDASEGDDLGSYQTLEIVKTVCRCLLSVINYIPFLMIKRFQDGAKYTVFSPIRRSLRIRSRRRK
jgi:hypothetical protein